MRFSHRGAAGAFVVAALAGTLLLTGCGGTAGGSGSGGGGTGKLTVNGAGGAVHLNGPAKRVVPLEYNLTEEVLSLGVKPVGAPEVKIYPQWVHAGPALPSSTPDIGRRTQPSLEKIKALRPDLIVAEKSRVAANLAQLKQIAPVLVFDSYPTGTDLVKHNDDNFRALATALGRDDKANQVLSAYGKKVDDAKKKLAGAGRAGTKVTLAQGFSVNGQPSIRAYTDGAQAVQVLTSIGLANAWKGQNSDPSGFTSIGVEGLTPVSDSTLLYVAQANDNPFTGALATNATWRNLGFVQQKRVHALDPGTWFWGGPESNGALVDQAVKALTG